MIAGTQPDILGGKVVLIAEDDHRLALEMSEQLARLGVSVVGPAPTVHYASLIMGKRQFDGAILGLKLFGEPVYPLAERLMRQRIPFVFTSGHEYQAPQRYDYIEILRKPICYETLVQRVSQFDGRLATKRVDGLWGKTAGLARQPSGRDARLERALLRSIGISSKPRRS